MKLSVEFPSVAYREGPEQVVELAKAIEAIGFDDLAMFDHVIMGYPTATRRAPMYPAQMPILEAFVTLGYVAAVTSRVTLSTEVLVLPQRQATLVAKQVSTLDTLSGGRMRLGVGVGWQAAEYEALGEEFATRGRRMDETIGYLRACWGDERIQQRGARFLADEIAMEPKPPQGERLPIWVGGLGAVALKRAGELGDGWMGMAAGSDDDMRGAIATIRGHADRRRARSGGRRDAGDARPAAERRRRQDLLPGPRPRGRPRRAARRHRLRVGRAQRHRDLPVRGAQRRRDRRSARASCTRHCAPPSAERLGHLSSTGGRGGGRARGAGSRWCPRRSRGSWRRGTCGRPASPR